ncbi:MAG: hypothetical protein BWK79_03990 [Beggiatoa sp. IS2]|nr:MAG: hypothetical protein BWK79_03990 [Beggiatoa sp. IS2]
MKLQSKDLIIGTSLIFGIIVLLIMLNLAMRYFLPDWQWQHTQLHVVLETVGMFIALTLAALTIVLHELEAAKPTQLWVGCALVGIGFLEGFHAVMYVESNDYLWLKSVTNFVGGISFGFVWLSGRLVCTCEVEKVFKRVMLICTGIGILSLLLSNYLPIMYLPDEGFTLPAHVLNTIGSIGFFIAAGYFARNAFPHPLSNLLFATHCLLFGLSVCLFQLSYIWDATWWFSHLFRFAAYFSLLYYILFLFRRAVTQLQTHRQRLRIITDLAPVGIFYADVQGHHQYVNERATKIIGLLPEQVIDEGWASRLHPDDKEFVIEQWYEAVHHQRPFKAHYRFQHPNGTPIWVSAQAIVEYTPAGNVKGYVGTLTDISETKQVEEQLLLYRYHLEELVVERANELVKTNRQLQQEIVERRQVETALRDSEARLAAILNIAADAIITIDETQRIILFNQGAERIFGHTANEVKGLPLDILLPPQLATVHREHTARFAREPISARHMGGYRYIVGRRKGGDEFPAEGSISKTTERGRTVFTAILRDISERQRVEQALRDSEERYKLATSSGKVGVWDWQVTNGKFYISPNFKAVLGFAESEMPNHLDAWLERIHPDDIDLVETKGRQCLKGLIQEYELEHRLLNKQGDILWVLVRGHVTRMASGEPGRFIGTYTDITERKQMERALQSSEQKYRNLLNDASDAILLLDVQGHIKEVNKKAELLFGYDHTELLGKHFTCLHPPHEIERVNCAFHNAFTNGWRTHFADEVCRKNDDILILTKQGEVIPVDITSNLIEYAEEKGLLKIIRDISDRKRAEVALEQERALLAQRVEERTAELQAANRALAKANRLKDEFLANVSHELRTPLNAILTISEGLQEQVFGTLNDKQLKYLKNVHESGSHLLAVITDILDLSKIEAGKIELQLDTVDLDTLCQASLRMVRETAQKKQLKLSYEIQTEIRHFSADERRLKQVLVNLLSNAVKFTPSGGKIGLRVTEEQDKLALNFIVWDTGIGIAAPDLPRLFQPFSQLDSGLARHYEGTGLGLVIVRRLVELHGGSISLESAVGTGSQFRVTIPYCSIAAQSNQSSGTELELLLTCSAITGESPLILLAEDNPMNIESLVPYLEKKGYRVEVAHDGGQVLQQARAIQPSVILMDIQMPGIDGLEAITYLRNDRNLQAIPIIALTGLAMPGDKQRCLDAGANAYMSKPLNLKELLRLIETYRQKIGGGGGI